MNLNEWEMREGYYGICSVVSHENALMEESGLVQLSDTEEEGDLENFANSSLIHSYCLAVDVDKQQINNLKYLKQSLSALS